MRMSSILSSMCISLVLLSSCISASGADEPSDSEENILFGPPQALSRNYSKSNIAMDSWTPIYGISRTQNYPLYRADNVAERAKRNFFRSPELLLPFLCCLACCAWSLLSAAVAFCFGNSYRCVLDLNHRRMCQTCVHYCLCCFLFYFYCGRGKRAQKQQMEHSCQVEDLKLDPYETLNKIDCSSTSTVC